MVKVLVGLVGYGMGNVALLWNAFQAVGAEVFITERPNDLGRATHLVLPGMGAFSKGMDQLHTLRFDTELRRLVSHWRHRD